MKTPYEWADDILYWAMDGGMDKPHAAVHLAAAFAECQREVLEAVIKISDYYVNTAAGPFRHKEIAVAESISIDIKNLSVG